jgi:hypothetical protein
MVRRRTKAQGSLGSPSRSLAEARPAIVDDRVHLSILHGCYCAVEALTTVHDAQCDENTRSEWDVTQPEEHLLSNIEG